MFKQPMWHCTNCGKDTPQNKMYMMILKMVLFISFGQAVNLQLKDTRKLFVILLIIGINMISKMNEQEYKHIMR